MDLKNLQQELLGIISLILAPASEEEVRDMQDRALKIIDELRDHINDDIEMNNLRITILDCIVSCDSHDGVRLNNRSLLDLEDAVKSIGGKTSQELGRRCPRMSEELMESGAEFAEFVASMEEEQNRRLREELRKKIYETTLAIFMMINSRTHLGESKVGAIVGATLGGLLSIPALMLGSRDITSREMTQRLVHSISEPMAGLSAALAGGTIMLASIIASSIVRSRAGINMEFGESLGSGLIATTAAAIGAGAGATLSMALARRMFAPVSTNLENVATEQPNIQGQNI